MIKVIYVFESARSGLLTIGSASDLESRRKKISRECGDEVTVLYCSQYLNNAEDIVHRIKLQSESNRTVGYWYENIYLVGALKDLENDFDVCEIQKMYDSGKSVRSISDRFKTSVQYVNRIVNIGLKYKPTESIEKVANTVERVIKKEPKRMSPKEFNDEMNVRKKKELQKIIDKHEGVPEIGQKVEIHTLKRDKQGYYLYEGMRVKAKLNDGSFYITEIIK